MKEECRKTHRDKLFHGLKCKDEFGKIMEYVDSLHYEDRVDYLYVYEMLRTVRLHRSFAYVRRQASIKLKRRYRLTEVLYNRFLCPTRLINRNS
uniref:Uncharacterized protein n=1 Tax=Parascaris equorum TaxID=6256 RepID=A0A914R9H7_PAREQ